jgi:phage terminase small subunit
VGRPQKSDALHRLQGTQAHASTLDPDDDSKTFVGGRLKMPDAYKQDPKRLAIWKKLFGALHRRRTLTKADSAAAELLVEQWVMWETVNAEAQAHPFSEVSWVDKNDIEHTKTVESAASKMASSLQRGIMQALKEFSATPASREKTKKTKEPALKPGKVQTEAERLDAEIARLESHNAVVDEPATEDLHSAIDETLGAPVMSEAQKLLEEADAALSEEDSL